MRRATRRIAFTTTFLAIAAGGSAACDNDAPKPVEETHRFYCTTGDGTVVNEDNCDDDGDGHGGMFFIYHSAAYPPGLAPGHKVPPGGRSFPYNDKASRTAWGLPGTGRVTNGSTAKVGVVGKGGAPIGAGGNGAGG